MAEQTPDSIITTQRNGQTIVAELFFNHSSTETFRDKLLKLVLADSTRLSASDGQEPEKTSAPVLPRSRKRIAALGAWQAQLSARSILLNLSLIHI